MNSDLKIPQGWIKTSIKEIVLNQKGKKPKVLQGSEFEDSVPYLDIRAFEKNEIRRYADKASSVEVDENDLIIVWDGARSGLVAKGMKGALGSTLVKLKPFIVEPEYIYHFLTSKYYYINSNAKGTGIPHVDPSILWGIEFPLPPIIEQSRIVDKIEELFSELDNGEEILNIVQNQLKQFRHALLKNAFEGELTKEWRKDNFIEPSEKLLKEIKKVREKHYDDSLKSWNKATQLWRDNGEKGRRPIKPKKIVQTNISDISKENGYSKIPQEWVYIKNKYLALKITDGEHLTPQRTKSGYYLLSARNIQNGYIDYTNVDYVGLDEYKRIRRRCNPEFGDILISCSGSVGRVSHVPKKSNFVMVRSVALIKYPLVQFDYRFLEYLYQSPQLQLQIEKGTKATAQANLFLGPIGELNLILCSIKEQKEIADLLDQQFSVCDKLEENISQGLEKSKVLRQSILKKAFEGRLVEQESNNKSGLKLLKLIQQEKKTFIEKHKKRKTNKRIKTMAKELSIHEVLKTSDKPMLAKDVWQQSKHKDNIEDFYAELKKIQDNVKEVKKGAESLLSLVS